MPLIQKSDSTKIPSLNDGEYVQFGIDSLTDQKLFQQHIFVLTTFFVQEFGAGISYSFSCLSVKDTVP